MTKEDLADAILSRISDWPDDAVNELFLAMGKIEDARGIYYELSSEEREEIDRGLADAEAGRFANDEEVAAVFAKFRLKPSKV
jgi:predicted transcriptional regulator